VDEARARQQVNGATCDVTCTAVGHGMCAHVLARGKEAVGHAAIFFQASLKLYEHAIHSSTAAVMLGSEHCNAESTQLADLAKVHMHCNAMLTAA
jgi:hypothetical protein